MTTPVVSGSINWDSWTPGSIPAARQAAKLDELIATAVGRNSQWSDRAAQRGSLLASIEDHRLDRLSIAVTDAVARGDSVDTLARTLRGVLDDPKWAEMVATTEMNRAMSAASLASYRDASSVITGKMWLCANDRDTCIACSTNEAAGAIPLDDDFPSGDDAPSAHPLCRCSLAPAVISLSDLGGGTARLGPSALGDLSEEDAALEDLGDETPVVEQHDTAGTTQPLSSADLAQIAAQRRAEREAAGQAPAVAAETVDVSRPSDDDLAARIAELPAGVAGLRLGPDAGLGRFRVGRRRKRTGKAAGFDAEDDEDDEAILRAVQRADRRNGRRWPSG